MHKSQIRDVRFGIKVGRIGTKWDKSWTFKIRFQYIMALGAIMYWNLIWKSHKFVAFQANLTHFGAEPVIPNEHPFLLMTQLLTHTHLCCQCYWPVSVVSLWAAVVCRCGGVRVGGSGGLWFGWLTDHWARQCSERVDQYTVHTPGRSNSDPVQGRPPEERRQLLSVFLVYLSWENSPWSYRLLRTEAVTTVTLRTQQSVVWRRCESEG